MIELLTHLPGIGRRGAERMAFHLLKSPSDESLALADAIRAIKTAIRHCQVCMALTENDRCAICEDIKRDRSTVLVVEQPKDLLALEQTGMYRGLYHVLMGRLSPLDGVGPRELTIADLLHRIDDPGANAGSVKIAEVILGLNPTLEGDGTALYLADQLRARGIRLSRLARGLPSGGSLELASKAVLADALTGRQSVG